MISIEEQYKKEALPKMRKKFGYKNNLAVPKIEKVIINTGFGRQVADKTGEEVKKIQESVLQDLSLLSGQRAVLTKAKQSIAGFKIRQGMAIGAKVTLRGKRMIDFLNRFVNLVLPRTRDFQGISLKSVDGSGNLTVAVREHIAFPEILPENTRNIFGLEVTVVTTAKNRAEGLELFRLLGFPMKKS